LGSAAAATGVVLLTPVCTNWSRSKIRKAYERGRKNVVSGLENAIDTLGEMANKVQQPMGDAAKAAKYSTAVAAGAVESAAHYVKERLQ
jgi:hypothetical protein